MTVYACLTHAHSLTHLHTHSVKQTFRVTHIDDGTQTPSESHPLRHTRTNPHTHTHKNPLTQTETSHTLSDTLILTDDIYSTKCNKHTHETPQEGGTQSRNQDFFFFFTHSRNMAKI